MSNNPENWNNEWAGFEPSNRRAIPWGCLLGVLVSLVLIAACAAAVYFAWQRLIVFNQPGQILTPPTAVSGAQATMSAQYPSDNDLPSIAPTVTLPANSSVGNVDVAQLTFVPSLDGNLQEWEELPFYTSEYRVFNDPSWDGTDDVTALWRLAWDANTLYVAVAVEDDRHVQTQTGNQIFKGDSVSLQIDTAIAPDLGPGLSQDDFQFNISPGDFLGIPPSVFRFRGSSSGSAVDAPGHNVVVAAQQVGEGYTLEIAIPWRDMDLSPVPGMVIGLALNVNDNDTPGTAVQEMMKSHVATRTFSDPSTWGTLTLQ